MARRFYRQAELEALIRYGPELSGLLELQRQAQQNRKQSIRGAKGNARAVINAVDVARPEVREIYDDADARLGRQTAMVASHNAELGPVSDTISAAAAIEAGAAKERIGEAKAASLESLSDRRVGAAQGRQFAVQQANSEFVDQIGQILNRKQDLRKEIGAFTQLTAGICARTRRTAGWT